MAKYSVVRTYSAGVHVGVVTRREGKEVDLAESRRIWNWRGRKTLSEIANHGVGAGSKVSEPVSLITLTEAIEIIECTDEAEKNLRSATWVE